MITAVCTCGAEWDVEGGANAPLSERLDARVAVLFADNRGVEVRRYNEHVKSTHKKGRA